MLRIIVTLTTFALFSIALVAKEQSPNLFAAYGFCNNSGKPLAYVNQISSKKDSVTVGWKTITPGQCTFDKVSYIQQVNAVSLLSLSGQDNNEYAFFAAEQGQIKNVMLSLAEGIEFLTPRQNKFLCTSTSTKKFKLKDISGDIFNSNLSEQVLSGRGSGCFANKAQDLAEISFNLPTQVKIFKTNDGAAMAAVRYFDIDKHLQVTSREAILSKQEFKALNIKAAREKPLSKSSWHGEFQHLQYDTFFPPSVYHHMARYNDDRVCQQILDLHIAKNKCQPATIYQWSKAKFKKKLEEQAIKPKDFAQALMQAKYVPSLPDLLNVWRSYAPDIEYILSEDGIVLRDFGEVLSHNVQVNYEKKSRLSKQMTRTVTYPISWYTEEVDKLKYQKKTDKLRSILQSLSPDELQQVNEWLASADLANFFKSYRNQKFNEEFGMVQDDVNEAYVVHDQQLQLVSYNKRQLFANSALQNRALYKYHKNLAWVKELKQNAKSPKDYVNTVKEKAVIRLATKGRHESDEKIIDSYIYDQGHATVFQFYGAEYGLPDYQHLRQLYLDKNKLSGLL